MFLFHWHTLDPLVPTEHCLTVTTRPAWIEIFHWINPVSSLNYPILSLSKVKKIKIKKAHRRANAALPHINVETGPLFSSSSGEGSMWVHSSFVVKWQLNRLFTSSNCSIHKGVSCCCFSAASLSSSSELSTNSVERVPASPKQTTCKKQGSRLPLLLWIYWTPSSNSVL